MIGSFFAAQFATFLFAQAPSAAAVSTESAMAALKTPFPTDAECLALGRPQTPLAFGPGETLEFEIDAIGAKAGRMTTRVLALRDGLLPVEVEVETNTFFSKIRRVRGQAVTSMNPKTLRPTRYYEDAKENDTHRIAEVSFRKDRTARLVSTVDSKTGVVDLRGGNEVVDIASAVFLLRALPLKEGSHVCFDAYGTRKMWRVWGTVLPREHVSLPLGEFKSWHLAGHAARVDLPDARREIHMWISDDAARLPLALMGTIDLGTVRATMTSIKKPGTRERRAENKGNLHW